MKSHTALNSTPLTRSFRPIDQVMDFAAKHKQSVVGHTQIFNRDGNYPAWLFKLAAGIDPKAKLTYNDFAVERPDRLKAILAFVRALRDKGCKIDVVGSQSHLEIGDKVAEQVDKMLQQFGASGYPLQPEGLARNGVMRTLFRSIVPILVGGVFMTESAYGGFLFTVGPKEKYTTISSALARMQDGDSCIVKEGVYRECIRVPQNRITLRGEGRVVVTGCDEAGSPTDAVVNGHKCVAFDVGKPVYEVFCGDWYLSMARFPNKTEPMTSNEDWAFATIEDNGYVTFTERDLAVPLNLEDGYYVGTGRFNAFFSLTLPILGLRENGSIRIDGDKASSGYLGQYNRKGIGYIIGARAALDTPGEWYTDGTQLWLIPPHNDPGRYEFRTRLYGVVVTGNGVALENLRFRAAAGRIEGNDVTLKKCTFEYISPFRHTPHPADEPVGQSMACSWGLPENGTAGVFVSGDGFVAEHCRFSKSWWCGMMLRGNKARIENCLFEDVNWMAKRCAGLFCWGDDNVVRYCTFRDLGGAGIEGGNASWVKQYAKRNIWEYNYIEGICKLIVDQGFFYVNHQTGSKPRANSIWRYNVGKGGYGPNKGKWSDSVAGYYLDNNSSGYRIHNNIAINVKQGIKYNDFRDGEQAGKDVWYYNNTLYNCLSLGIEPKGNPDADLNLVNNLAILPGTLRFSKNLTRSYGWQNNLDSVPSDAVRDPDAMDFTPTRKDLKEGGIPVMNTAMPYIGAVDPAKGMWRYGADESKLQTR